MLVVKSIKYCVHDVFTRGTKPGAMYANRFSDVQTQLDVKHIDAAEKGVISPASTHAMLVYRAREGLFLACISSACSTVLRLRRRGCVLLS